MVRKEVKMKKFIDVRLTWYPVPMFWVETDKWKWTMKLWNFIVIALVVGFITGFLTRGGN